MKYKVAGCRATPCKLWFRASGPILTKPTNVILDILIEYTGKMAPQSQFWYSLSQIVMDLIAPLHLSKEFSKDCSKDFGKVFGEVLVL